MKSITLTPKVKLRFNAKITKGGDGECHVWTAAKHSGGYGVMMIEKKLHYAHRIAYTIHHGPIPEGMMIDHMCFNRLCVNPDHLRLASVKQNGENRENVRAASGFRGVHRNGKGWRAVVRHNYIEHAGPTVYSPEEANEMAITMRRRLFSHSLLDQ